MNGMFTFLFTKLLELQFRRALGYTDTCAIIPFATLPALKPDIFPFALFFSHKVRSHPAGELPEKYLLLLQRRILDIVNYSEPPFAYDTRDVQ